MLELVPLLVIRDNLTLNVWMLACRTTGSVSGKRVPRVSVVIQPMHLVTRGSKEIRFVRMLVLGMSALLASAFAATAAHAYELRGPLTSMTSARPSRSRGSRTEWTLELGWRGEPIIKLRLQQYLHVGEYGRRNALRSLRLLKKVRRQALTSGRSDLQAHTGSTRIFRTESNDELDCGLVLSRPS